MLRALQFPPCFEETVARLVHHATLKQEDLSQRIVTYFKDHFVVGEELFALRDDKEAALRVSACVDTANQYHDCEHPSFHLHIYRPPHYLAQQCSLVRLRIKDPFWCC